MKTLVFSLLTAAAVAADTNTINAGPTTNAITSSSITFTPSVTSTELTVVVTSTWTMAEKVEMYDVMQLASCF